MFIQIEVTTRCNFSCFYCAGRDMPQSHMTSAVFDRILGILPRGQHTLSLQGEGEPMLHPQFWGFVRRVRNLGHMPYTITNGSRINPDRVARLLPFIGLSLDTLDPAEATQLGRHNLPKVMRNLQTLLAKISPERIVIHTVNFGQDLAPLRSYLRTVGIRRHVVQPLQRKLDYSYRYADRIQPVAGPYKYDCRFLTTTPMRYYNINGREFPCCYIKDERQFRSIDDLRKTFQQHVVPVCCAGCREILSPAGTPESLMHPRFGTISTT